MKDPVIALALVMPLIVCCAIADADVNAAANRFHRNSVSSETGLPTYFRVGRKSSGSLVGSNILWTAKLGSYALTTPAVADGRVYVGSSEYSRPQDPRFPRCKAGLVLCLDALDGTLIWKLVVPGPDAELGKFIMEYLGICSSPIVENSRVYVVSHRGEVLCLDVEGQANGNDGPFLDEAAFMVPEGTPAITLGKTDADIIWRFNMIDIPISPHDAFSSSVVILGDFLYLVTGNGGIPVLEKDAPTLIVLNKHTGRLVATDGELIGRRMMHGHWASPALGQVGGKNLIFLGGGDGVCYAFDALSASPGVPELGHPSKLKLAWKFDCNPREYRFDASGRRIDYQLGDNRRGVKNPRQKSPTESIATPVFYNGRVYVATGQEPTHGTTQPAMLHCIDASGSGDITTTGKVWSREMLRSMSTVSVADGLLYIGDIAGNVSCFDADTGELYWTHKSPKPKTEIWGSTLVADGKVYVGSRQRMLTIFEHSKEREIVSEFRLPGRCGVTPTAANGVLYVACDGTLVAAAEKGSATGSTAPPAVSARPASVATVSPAEGLAFLLTFDEGIKDEGPASVAIEASGVSLVKDGRYDKACRFENGATVSVGTLGMSEHGTWAAWVRGSKVQEGAVARIMDANGYMLGISGDGIIAQYCDGPVHNLSTDGYSAERWTHIAMVWDDETCILYVNGVSREEIAIDGPPAHPKRRLIIGARWTGKGMGFTGELDEVCVYARALSDRELRALMEDGSNRR
jgi:outer membrane protein assembly factor BamB